MGAIGLRVIKEVHAMRLMMKIIRAIKIICLKT